MTSIFFLKEAIYCNIFRCKYLRNKKYFLNSFLHFVNSDSTFNIFKKKRWLSQVMYFWTYGFLNTRLDKCLKSPVSEDPSTRNMANGLKQCWKLHDNTFTMFNDPCETNSGLKSLSECFSKSYDIFLIYSLLIRNIFFLTEAIYWNIFRCNYLRNEKYFLNFFLNFLDLNSILNILTKKVIFTDDVFLNLQTPKNVIR